MVFAIAGANPRTIVVLKDGGPVLMPWLNSVLAVAEVWYPGQEDGHIVANLLFGVTNLSGKVPITFPRKIGRPLRARSLRGRVSLSTACSPRTIRKG